MDYPFYFNLCPDELELRRSLVVPEFVPSDHLPQLNVDEKSIANTATAGPENFRYFLKRSAFFLWYSTILNWFNWYQQHSINHYDESLIVYE